MAAQLRPLKGREVLRKLRKAGFEIVRTQRKRLLSDKSPNRQAHVGPCPWQSRHSARNTKSHRYRTSRPISRRFQQPLVPLTQDCTNWLWGGATRNPKLETRNGESPSDVINQKRLERSEVMERLDRCELVRYSR